MTMPTDIEIVDLGIGFPYTSIEQKMAAYDFFRANLKDAQSVRGDGVPRPVHVQGRARHRRPEDTDLVEWIVEQMDAFNIRIARVGLSPNGIEAQRRYPDRFVIGMSVDPNDVMGAHAQDRDGEGRARRRLGDDVPVGLRAAGRDRRPEDVPAVREVRRARHPDVHQRRHRRAAHAELAPAGRAASTRSATTSPISPS